MGDVADDLKPLYARQMEVYAGFPENGDYKIGRVMEAIEELGEPTTPSSSRSGATTAPAWRERRPARSTR